MSIIHTNISKYRLGLRFMLNYNNMFTLNNVKFHWKLYKYFKNIIVNQSCNPKMQVPIDALWLKYFVIIHAPHILNKPIR